MTTDEDTPGPDHRKRKDRPDVMVRHGCGPLQYFQFAHLAQCRELGHAVFTRHGGVSRPPYHGLNVGDGVGDESACIAANREMIRDCMSAATLQPARQVHGSVILRWPKDGGEHPDAGDGRVCPGDALITDIPGKYLLVQVADCQPVFIYDPTRRVAANVHSGWRGSVANVIGKTVDAMCRDFGCHAADMLAGIGPSLGPCCAEFIHYRDEIPKAFWPYRVSDHHFNFWEISRMQLVQSGIPEHRIEVGRMCTRCSTSDFYSYRSERDTGRFAAVIGLRS